MSLGSSKSNHIDKPKCNTLKRKGKRFSSKKCKKLKLRNSASHAGHFTDILENHFDHDKEKVTSDHCFKFSPKILSITNNSSEKMNSNEEGCMDLDNQNIIYIKEENIVIKEESLPLYDSVATEFNEMESADEKLGIFHDGVNESFISNEKVTELSFCPKIDKVYTTSTDIESDHLDSTDDNFQVNEREKISQTDQFRGKLKHFGCCQICSVSFFTESAFMSHFQSIVHRNNLLTSKNKDSYAKTPIKHFSKNIEASIKLGNKAKCLEPVTYIPLNLIRGRIIICGKRNVASTRGSGEKGREEYVSSGSRNLKPDSLTYSRDTMESGESQLPIVFIPYQVRVNTSIEGEPKLLTMYLPHFDQKTSHSFIEESILFPPDAWVGDVVEPIKESINISFNNNMKERPEVAISHVLAPTADVKSKDGKKNYVPIRPKTTASNNQIYKLSSKNEKKSSSDTDTAEETEEMLLDNLSLPNVPAQKETKSINSFKDKPQAMCMHGKLDNEVKDKPLISKINFKRYLSKGTLLPVPVLNESFGHVNDNLKKKPLSKVVGKGVHVINRKSGVHKKKLKSNALANYKFLKPIKESLNISIKVVKNVNIREIT